MILGILNIQPENVNRDILFIEAFLHTPDVVGTDIVPSALMVSQRPMRRKLNGSSQFRVLAEDLVGRGSGKKEDVKDTRLGDPVSSSRFLCGVNYVNPSFGSGSDEDCDGGICRVCVYQGNRPVQRGGGGSDVFEDIVVIKPVWIIEE